MHLGLRPTPSAENVQRTRFPRQQLVFNNLGLDTVLSDKVALKSSEGDTASDKGCDNTGLIMNLSGLSDL